MAESSQMPVTVDLEPVQLVGPDGMPTAELRYSRDLPEETLCYRGLAVGYRHLPVHRCGVDADQHRAHVDDGVPVINHPEAAILGMGAIKPRPVVVGDEVVVRPTMTLTCVFDHRVADGAQVAQFICELRDLIESLQTVLLDL